MRSAPRAVPGAIPRAGSRAAVVSSAVAATCRDLPRAGGGGVLASLSRLRVRGQLGGGRAAGPPTARSVVLSRILSAILFSAFSSVLCLLTSVLVGAGVGVRGGLGDTVRVAVLMLGLAVGLAIGLADGLSAGVARAEEVLPTGAAPTVAAAASMGPLVNALADQYEQQTGSRPILVLAASGHLSRQLVQGAPYDLFLSADTEWMARTVAAGAIDGDTVRPFAQAPLVLVYSRGAPQPAPTADTAPATASGTAERGPHSAIGIAELRQVLAAEIRYVTLANPETAPFGRAARQVLAATGLWARLEPKLVYGENVGQAWQFLKSGNAELGLVAGSLAVGGDLPWRTVQAQLYEPLVQTAGLSPGAGAGAQEFLDLLLSPRGQALLEAHGYLPVGAETAGTGSDR